MSDDAFLQAICETPEDDAPRLIYADWLEEDGDGARAEFIRVQCRLAVMSPNDPWLSALRERVRQLLKHHKQKWLGPYRAVGDWPEVTFYRGFVQAIHCPRGQGLEELLAAAPTLFNKPTTVQRLGLGQAPGRRVLTPAVGQLLAELPGLSNLRQLGVISAGVQTGFLRALLASPHLSRLTELNLKGSRLGAWIPDLTETPWPTGLVNLAIDGRSSGINPEASQRGDAPVGSGLELFAGCSSVAQLKYLTLIGHQFAVEGVRTLFNSSYLRGLVSLDLPDNEIGAGGASALAQSPYLDNLKSLDLFSNDIEDHGAQALAASLYLGRLNTLRMGGNLLTAAGEDLLRERFGERLIL